MGEKLTKALGQIYKEQRELRKKIEFYDELKELLLALNGCFADKYIELREYAGERCIREFMGKMVEEQKIGGVFVESEVVVYGDWVRIQIEVVEVWFPLGRGKNIIKIILNSSGCQTADIQMRGEDILRLLYRNGDIEQFRSRGWQILKQGFNKETIKRAKESKRKKKKVGVNRYE